MNTYLKNKQDFNTRLSGYAALAGTLLTLSSVTDAQVIWSGLRDTVFYPEGTHLLDLNNNDLPDFEIIMNSSFTSSNFSYTSTYRNFWVRSGFDYIASPNSDTFQNSWMVKNSNGRPFGLFAGDTISKDSNHWKNNHLSDNSGLLGVGYVSYFKTISSYRYEHSYSGSFLINDKFLGVRFNIDNEQHYGWIRLNIPESIDKLTIRDWAYQNLPDSGIIAGGVEPSFINEKFYNNNVVQIQLYFPVEIQNLTKTDFIIQNGIITDLLEEIAGRQYRLEINATDMGKVNITLPMDSVQNSSGLIILPSSTEFTYDTLAPTVTIQPPFEISKSFRNTIHIEFNEKIRALSLENFNIVNGVASNIQELIEGKEFTFDIQSDTNGITNIELPAGAVFDLAGNGNEFANASYKIDTISPKVIIHSENASTQDPMQQIEVTFDEKISGLVLEDFAITNGTASNLTTIVDSISYSIDVTAETGGEVNILLPENSVFDIAGNGNMEGIEEFNYTPDVWLERTTSNDFEIYPNPAKNNVYFKSQSEAEISIINTNGETIFKKESSGNEPLQLGELRSGIYIIQVQINGNIFHRKLIIE